MVCGDKLLGHGRKVTEQSKVILNLGCGETRIKSAVNVDFVKTEYCDEIVDLGRFPWPWEDNSVDEIYVLHIIEHFDSETVIKTFKEAHRILKVGGLLHVQCPHFSSMLSVTCVDHKKAFGVTTFGFLEGNNYILPEPLFKKELTKINFLLLLHSENKYVDFDLKKTKLDKGKHPLMRKFLWPFGRFIQFWIDLSPTLFERCWCYWVGGADELIYRGRKV